MKKNIELTEAGRQYATAYAAHYTARDLPTALQLYLQLMASHPSDQEASYSRTQVQNIINAVVPRQELQDVEVGLALAQFEHHGSGHARPTDASPPVSQLST